MKRSTNRILGMAMAGIRVGSTTTSCSGKADAAGTSAAAKENLSAPAALYTTLTSRLLDKFRHVALVLPRITWG